MDFDTLLEKIGNKSVFDKAELRRRYDDDKNVLIIEMLYYGYFGAGNNVNMSTLESRGHWSKSHGNQYPALIKLSHDDFIDILQIGKVSVNNVIIN